MSNATLSEILVDLLNQNEKQLLGELNDLVDKGLLKIAKSTPMLVQNEAGKIELKREVSFSIDEAEYIKKLEERISVLEEKLAYRTQAVPEYIQYTPTWQNPYHNSNTLVDVFSGRSEPVTTIENSTSLARSRGRSESW